MLRIVVCSQFFQEPELWVALQPMLAQAAKGADHAFRAWSAGCGSGKETYSVAMMLDSVGIGRTAVVIGTDIDEGQLARAGAGGPYTAQDVRDLSAEERATYLEPGGPPYFIVEGLRRRVTHRRHDLRRDPFPEHCDLVLYRSLETCFSATENLSIYKRFAEALRPGGLLFIGAADRAHGIERFGFEQRAPSLYGKP
jgi:chemotaxis protein methyltransferase CheR